MKAAVAALGAAAAWWCGPAAAPVCRPVADLYGIPCRLDHDRGVALTFDDGPHPRGTPAILEQLHRFSARATFFLVGEQVERYPATARLIVAAGHEVALHGHVHRLLLRVPPGSVAADLERGRGAIEDATGVRPLLCRPPYGVVSAAALRAARALAQPLLWSSWGRDWEAHATGAAIARRASSGLVRGDVVLLHDADHYSAPGSWRATAAALPTILAAVASLRVPAVSVTQST